jgi:hypothetical protein
MLFPGIRWSKAGGEAWLVLLKIFSHGYSGDAPPPAYISFSPYISAGSTFHFFKIGLAAPRFEIS